MTLLRASRFGGRALLSALLLAAIVGGVAADEVEWRRARAGYDWSFPRDHFSHPGYATEWWYVTGQLETVGEPRRRFGYQFTLFRIGVSPSRPEGTSRWGTANAVMGHAALGDLDRGEHRFAELLYREVPFLAEFEEYAPDGGGDAAPIAWTRGPVGTDDTWNLDWNGEGFDFRAGDRARGFSYELSTRPTRPLVFQGPGGVSRKAREGDHASLYYSFTRLETRGNVTIDGETVEVRGESWMDKEFGSGQMAEHQAGWDWFSLQLTDGRDLMLYVLRDRGGRMDYGSGTLVAHDGTVRYLRPDDWRLEATGTWQSAATDATYPSGWRIALPDAGLDFEVRPAFAAQENVGRLGNIAYWEGAVTVHAPDGTRIGGGYVELTGYGENNRPGL